VIKPRLFGEQLGVSSVWILISLVIGGRLLGVAGILLAIPFAAIGDFIYHDYIIKRLEEQNAENEKLKEAAHEGIKTAGSFAAETMVDLTAAAAAGVRSIVPAEDDPEDVPEKAEEEAVKTGPEDVPEKAEKAPETDPEEVTETSETPGTASETSDVSDDLAVQEAAPAVEVPDKEAPNKDTKEDLLSILDEFD
jgi:hypothetical protein